MCYRVVDEHRLSKSMFTENGAPHPEHVAGFKWPEGVEPLATDDEKFLLLPIDVYAVTMRKRRVATQSRHSKER